MNSANVELLIFYSDVQEISHKFNQAVSDRTNNFRAEILDRTTTYFLQQRPNSNVRDLTNLLSLATAPPPYSETEQEVNSVVNPYQRSVNEFNFDLQTLVLDTKRQIDERLLKLRRAIENSIELAELEELQQTIRRLTDSLPATLPRFFRETEL